MKGIAKFLTIEGVDPIVDGDQISIVFPSFV